MNETSHLAFEQVSEITQGVWDIKAHGNSVFVATSEGLYRFPKDFSTRPVLMDRNPVNSIYVDYEKELIIFSGSKGTQVVNSTNFSPIYFVPGTFTTTTGIAKQIINGETSEYWV